MLVVRVGQSSGLLTCRSACSVVSGLPFSLLPCLTHGLSVNRCVHRFVCMLGMPVCLSVICFVMRRLVFFLPKAGLEREMGAVQGKTQASEMWLPQSREEMQTFSIP